MLLLTPPPELFVAHERVWRDEGEIVVQQPNVNPYMLPPKLNWGQLLVDNVAATEFDFFRLLFPMRFMNEVIIPLTNQKLNTLQQSILQPDEFLLFLGITLSMALQPIRGGIDAYWGVEKGINDTIYTPGNYGHRFKMSKHRFKCIRRCMTFGTTVQTPTVPGVQAEPDKDPWGAIRPFVNANTCRSKCVTPGRVLTVDEVMSMWLGLDGEYAVEGLPHVTKIQRKPRGIGAELKAAADGQSGIMLHLEMIEGKEREKVKKWHAEYGHGCAVLMRCVEKYKGSGRHVIADSAFGSPKTQVAVHTHLGMYTSLAVKTAHREYPKAFMAGWYAAGSPPNPKREIGSHIVLKVLFKRFLSLF
jgi:hypothetical protein